VTITVDDWHILLANQQTGWAAQKQGASLGADAHAGQKLLGRTRSTTRLNMTKPQNFISD